jgi:hypothetical protein
MTILLSLVLGVIVLILLGLAIASIGALLKACQVLRKHSRAGASLDFAPLVRSPLMPGVSVLAVSSDTSPESRAFVRRLLALQFSRMEVMLVLDGLSSTELAAWIGDFRLVPIARTPADDLPSTGVRKVYASTTEPRLKVVARSGLAADALKAGIQAASFPLIAAIGRECDFDNQVLLRLIIPMLEDEGLTAVCGAGSAPPAGGLAGKFGALESLRAWMTRCAAFSDWNALAPTPGSALLFRRDAIVTGGGFSGGMLEVVLRLQGLAHRDGRPRPVVFLPNIVKQSRAPRSFSKLRSRLAREQAEIAGVLARRESLAAGVPAAGWALQALFAARFLRPLLESIACLLAAAGWALGWFEPSALALVLLATAGTGMLISMAAVSLRELADPSGSDPALLARLFFAAIPENLGYRQLRNLWLLLAMLPKTERASLVKGRPAMRESE